MTAERWYKIQLVYSSRRIMLSAVRPFKVQTVGSQLRFDTNTRGRRTKLGAITPLRLESATDSRDGHKCILWPTGQIPQRGVMRYDLNMRSLPTSLEQLLTLPSAAGWKSIVHSEGGDHGREFPK
jgi:hypothetical protein